MIEAKVQRTLKKYNMISPGDKVVIAASGGVDSTALLHVLNSLKATLKIKLFAAHLNHKLRGRDAELDAGFVKETCKKLRIPVFIEEFDVQAFAEQNRLGLEDAARRVRYEYFERIAARMSANKIALAHNADDNIETFLMRLIRGSGLKGLESIPALRGRIIRPFIEVSRKEIEAYLRSINVRPRIDRTNFETRFMRNRVRRNLLPVLESYNKKIREVILRTISAVAADHDFIRKQAGESLMKAMISRKKNEVAIDMEGLSRLEPAIKAEALRLAIGSVKKDLVDISFVHIEDILGIMDKGRGEIDLPGAYIYVKKGALVISRTKHTVPEAIPFMHKLEVPGQAMAEEAGFVIDAELVDHVKRSELLKKDPYIAYLDYDKISKPLFIRGRKDGDVFSPLGLKGKKKLQDIFVDSKVAQENRSKVPVLEDGKKIVWIVGYRISEEAKVTSKTKKVVKISAQPL